MEVSGVILQAGLNGYGVPYPFFFGGGARKMKHYTYLLRCGDGSLYCGWTNDLPKRLHAHASGKGGKYTRTHLPVALVYAESFATKQEAMRREVQIKRMTRQEKLDLIARNQNAKPTL